MGELLDGSEPADGLGEQEAAFFGPADSDAAVPITASAHG
jgi:hypothetical protein